MLLASKRLDRLIDAIGAMISEEFAGPVLPFDSSAAKTFAAVFLARQAAGRHISFLDCQIAATARAHGRHSHPQRNRFRRLRGQEKPLGARHLHQVHHARGQRQCREDDRQPYGQADSKFGIMGIEFLWQVARVHQGEQIRYIFYLNINYLTNNHT